MYSVTSISERNPVQSLQKSNVTAIKKIAGRPASEQKTKLAQHIHCALTKGEMALEEDFYVFDYGNAI